MATEQKYNTIKEYLDHLIAGREISCVEFKYGKGGFPHKEFWPSYSSFANTDGGVVIIGVKENNRNFSGGESICRNPALQTMFLMIGAVEKAGSGADTIVQGWDDAKFGTPVISEKSEPNKVELTLPIISDGDSNGTSNRDNENDKESLNDRVNTDDDPVNDLVNRKDDPVNRENELVKSLLAVYNSVVVNPKATYTEVADQLNISIATVKRNLQKLKEQNYLKREGSDKTGKWIIL